MGTRNLTAVMHGGLYKIAQYGQWDGYPGGQGVKALAFCQKWLTSAQGREAVIDRLSHVRFVSEKDLKAIFERAGNDGFERVLPYVNRDHGAGILELVMKWPVYERMETRFLADGNPEERVACKMRLGEFEVCPKCKTQHTAKTITCRQCGYVVTRDSEQKIDLRDDIEFAGDSLFCEWAYVIDLDKGTFEVFKGFNKTPLTEGDRFFKAPREERRPNGQPNEYEPIKLVREWFLYALPSKEDFLSDPAFKADEGED